MNTRVMPGTVPVTGLPAFRPYVYRGTGVDSLTPRITRGPMPRRKPANPNPPDGRCDSCGYPFKSRNHHWVCD